MSEIYLVAITSLTGVLIGSLTTLSSQYLSNRFKRKEVLEEQERLKFDNHSRVFRKISYEIDKFLEKIKILDSYQVEAAMRIEMYTESLIFSIESLDDTKIDGVGVKLYYDILYLLKDIELGCLSYQEKKDFSSNEIAEIAHANGNYITEKTAELEVINTEIKKQHIEKANDK